MTDERIDALIRQLDVTSSPDAAFMSSSLAMLQRQARAARIQDVSPLGRLRRELSLALAPALVPGLSRRGALAWLAILALIAVAAAIVIAGAFNRVVPVRNGLLVVTAQGELRAIDVDTGAIHQIAVIGENDGHVSRSPDGRLVAYWKVDPGGDQLVFLGIDGGGKRLVALEEAVTWAGCVDNWSPDSRFVASEVKVGGISRILIADSVSGTSRFVTPSGVIGHCPLWSPDGGSIAFAQEQPSGPGVLSIIGADGSDLRDVSGDIGGADVAGANSWSSDGAWIYFTTGGESGSNWRANVDEAASAELTKGARFATAIAASPDDSLITWIVSTQAGLSTQAGWNLYVANSDGTDPRLLLGNALSCGWSADGRYILARWAPFGAAGGLVVLTPDGTERRLVLPAAQGGLDPDEVCDAGWGQARP